MSWFKAFRTGAGFSVAKVKLRPVALGAVLLASGSMLGACSFQPVYSGALASRPMLDLAFAKPNSRLEQIIYQELALRLGSSASETAPLAKVSVAIGSGGNSMRSANTSATDFAQTSVTATLTITGLAEPLTISRTATAQYTTSGQVLADTTAATEARERAAKAAAESLRLGVLAALSR